MRLGLGDPGEKQQHRLLSIKSSNRGNGRVETMLTQKVNVTGFRSQLDVESGLSKVGRTKLQSSGLQE